MLVEFHHQETVMRHQRFGIHFDGDFFNGFAPGLHSMATHFVGQSMFADTDGVNERAFKSQCLSLRKIPRQNVNAGLDVHVLQFLNPFGLW